jgi:hypothetical protein
MQAIGSFELWVHFLSSQQEKNGEHTSASLVESYPLVAVQSLLSAQSTGENWGAYVCFFGRILSSCCRAAQCKMGSMLLDESFMKRLQIVVELLRCEICLLSSEDEPSALEHWFIWAL